MELLRTEDGSLTLRHELLGELYHSDRGAVGEAEHVYIRAGFDAILKKEKVSVFEVGFGTGLNSYLTYKQALATHRSVDYQAIDLYPLPPKTVAQLDYTSDPVFNRLHALPWDGTPYELADNHQFTLTKYCADLLTFDFSALAERFDAVYFDAFAPDVQPELWSERIMAQMFSILRSGGLLVTYSAKGTVKQALRTAGFEVCRLPGALGKRHMVRAVKPARSNDLDHEG
ncbi:MAG: tRNA (5-methylaminomethyl-2-thiouridine)(34)-methyltransferase MnmD [Rikenella sp.]|nr:tRNA (5-methylaminomethyl-2-thiouridine)(34)-methyltransferase MnmD [Rikenella sp.]